MVSLMQSKPDLGTSRLESFRKSAIGVLKAAVHSAISAGEVDLGSGQALKAGQEFSEIVPSRRKASDAGEQPGVAPAGVQRCHTARRSPDQTA